MRRRHKFVKAHTYYSARRARELTPAAPPPINALYDDRGKYSYASANGPHSWELVPAPPSGGNRFFSKCITHRWRAATNKACCFCFCTYFSLVFVCSQRNTDLPGAHRSRFVCRPPRYLLQVHHVSYFCEKLDGVEQLSIILWEHAPSQQLSFILWESSRSNNADSAHNAVASLPSANAHADSAREQLELDRGICLECITPPTAELRNLPEKTTMQGPSRHVPVNHRTVL